MDKISKLSQAIRLGSTFRPKIRHLILTEEGSCAIGAAAEAVGFIKPKQNIPATWRVVARLAGRFPAVKSDTWAMIVYLNDKIGHSRERIADWLESQGL